MRRMAFVFMMLLTVLFACSSEETNDGGFLWKTESGDTTVYLQGTIHVGNEDFYPLNEEIENAYEASDVVLPEVDLNEVDEEELLTMMTQLATYEDDRTIRDDLSQDTYEALEEILEEHSMPLAMMESFKPWFLESMLSELALEETDYSAEYGVDIHFLDRALEDGKEVRELESYEGQMEMLAGFSDDIQIEMLESAILHYDEMDEGLDELVGYWQSGDLEELGKASEAEETFEGYEEYMEEINTNRNINMADTILDLLEADSGETYFVIVGALHMVEEPSIVSLIKEEGYEVEHIY